MKMLILKKFNIEKINENFRQLEKWISQLEGGFRLKDGSLLYTKDGLRFQVKEAK